MATRVGLGPPGFCVCYNGRQRTTKLALAATRVG